MERQNRAGYRSVAGTRNGYQGQITARAAVNAPAYPREYPRYTPARNPFSKPAPQPVAPVKEAERPRSVAERKRVLRTFCLIATVFAMCFMMIYRYAMILETNALISEMNQQVTELESDNQFLEAKLDRALELGSLEEYATQELGMIRPDTSQMFYVNIHMEDSANMAEDAEESRVLQGAPGALVHAIRVLK